MVVPAELGGEDSRSPGEGRSGQSGWGRRESFGVALSGGALGDRVALTAACTSMDSIAPVPESAALHPIEVATDLGVGRGLGDQLARGSTHIAILN